MEEVGITKGCAIVPVAKIRIMKLNVHSAMPREKASLLGLALGRGAAKGAVSVCFLGFFRLMRGLTLLYRVIVPTGAKRAWAHHGAIQCLHACQGISRVARRDL